MFYSNKVITFCIVITALLSFITGANTQQFQQPQTYQYAFGEGRRRLYNGGGFGGFGGSASAPSASSDFIKFPEDDHRNVPATSLFHGKDDERQEQEMHHVKGPNLEEHDESLNEVSCKLMQFQTEKTARNTDEKKCAFFNRLLIAVYEHALLRFFHLCCDDESSY